MEKAVPVRIQRKRTKGWRMPEGAVYVGRPTKWGNPISIADAGSPEAAVDHYRYFCGMDPDAPLHFGNELRERAKRELRGKDLACWCPLDRPCHADVLIELANLPLPEGYT
jgi:hypothetical protein